MPSRGLFLLIVRVIRALNLRVQNTHDFLPRILSDQWLGLETLRRGMFAPQKDERQPKKIRKKDSECLRFRRVQYFNFTSNKYSGMHEEGSSSGVGGRPFTSYAQISALQPNYRSSRTRRYPPRKSLSRKSLAGPHCAESPCDAKMHHMKKATVRDLRYKFPKIEAELLSGEEIEITKRNRVIARLMPVRPQRPRVRPDFLKMLRDIYGDKIMKMPGVDLVSEQRGRF